MKIECVTLGPLETNCYLLCDDTGTRCALVDTPPDAGEQMGALIRERGLSLDALLLTHGHWDHVADAHRFTAAVPKVAVFGHRDDTVCFESPERFMFFYQMGIPGLTEADFQPVKITRWVAEGDVFELWGKSFEVRHVPGHCPGNVLFYCAEEKFAFTGDAIFARSVGRSDLPGGSWPVLLKSIRERIYTLPADTVLLPGHGPATTVGDEVRGNPYARPENKNNGVSQQ
ncbi:MAG: MBL fold metallo-hydrolase [Puniceicoccales bacterium]|jgi:glyoxylase-like metal-dependent hydrolase (beta-lactamase superfamily II)|nr:MBL fold metallo-hydrolase [Puniceicoccales bacterium]